MTTNLPAGRPSTVRATFTDAHGQPAHVQGEVKWKSSNESIAMVVANRPDSKSATVTPLGPSGTFSLEAQADADLGDGVRRVSVTLDCRIVGGGTAVGGEITVERPDPNRPVDPGFGVPGGGGPVDPGFGQPGSERPDQGLPGHPGQRPDNSLPGSGGRPDNSLPGGGASGGRPDQGLPPSSGRPDRSLPGSQPGVDNELPGSGGQPDNSLPPGAAPKGRR